MKQKLFQKYKILTRRLFLIEIYLIRQILFLGNSKYRERIRIIEHINVSNPQYSNIKANDRQLFFIYINKCIFAIKKVAN